MSDNENDINDGFKELAHLGINDGYKECYELTNYDMGVVEGKNKPIGRDFVRVLNDMIDINDRMGKPFVRLGKNAAMVLREEFFPEAWEASTSLEGKVSTPTGNPVAWFWGHFQKLVKVDWSNAGPAKQELYYAFTSELDGYTMATTGPKFPPEPNVCYLNRPIVTRSESDYPKLRGLNDNFFTYTSEVDYWLRIVAWVTMFWGNSSKPVFVLLPARGSGQHAGKSSIVDTVAAGLGTGVSTCQDPDKIAKTILNRLAGPATCNMIDNWKGHLDCGRLASVIGRESLEEHILYSGWGTVANSFTYAVSSNFISWDSDWADRVVPIEVDAGNVDDRKGSWASDVRRYLQANRLDLFREIKTWIETEPRPRQQATRLMEWDDVILSKVPIDLDQTILTIKERQRERNTEAGEKTDLHFEVEALLMSYGYDVEKDVIFLPRQFLINAARREDLYGERIGPKKLLEHIRHACGRELPNLYDGGEYRPWYEKEGVTLRANRGFFWSPYEDFDKATAQVHEAKHYIQF
jgi:hypothetical protein